jgi:hypothetical protein
MNGRLQTKTTRMSIDVPLKDHKRIKVLAAAEGLTIRDFVIDCINEKIHPEKKPNKTTKKAMEAARKGKVSRAKNFNELCKHIGI